jgi:hypothetical protein
MHHELCMLGDPAWVSGTHKCAYVPACKRVLPLLAPKETQHGVLVLWTILAPAAASDDHVHVLWGTRLHLGPCGSHTELASTAAVRLPVKQHQHGSMLLDRSMCMLLLHRRIPQAITGQMTCCNFHLVLCCTSPAGQKHEQVPARSKKGQWSVFSSARFYLAQ